MPPDVTIRPARFEDEASIGRVIDQAHHATYEGMLTPHRIRLLSRACSTICGVALRAPSWQMQKLFLVAVSGGEVVGFCFAWVHPVTRDPEFRHVFVLPAYQGQGIGRELWRRVGEYFRRLGFAYASVGVLTTNTRARAFVERGGGVLVNEHSFGYPYHACQYQVPLVRWFRPAPVQPGLYPFDNPHHFWRSRAAGWRPDPIAAPVREMAHELFRHADGTPVRYADVSTPALVGVIPGGIVKDSGGLHESAAWVLDHAGLRGVELVVGSKRSIQPGKPGEWTDYCWAEFGGVVFLGSLGEFVDAHDFYGSGSRNWELAVTRRLDPVQVATAVALDTGMAPDSSWAGKLTKAQLATARGQYERWVRGSGRYNLPTLISFTQVVEAVRRAEIEGRVLYVRHSAGPDFDKAAGYRSRKNPAAGGMPRWERGLSVLRLSPEVQGLPAPDLERWVALHLTDYQGGVGFSPEFGETPREDPTHTGTCWLTEGTECGRGGDDEPLLSGVRPTAYVSSSALQEASDLLRVSLFRS